MAPCNGVVPSAEALPIHGIPRGPSCQELLHIAQAAVLGRMHEATAACLLILVGCVCALLQQLFHLHRELCMHVIWLSMHVTWHCKLSPFTVSPLQTDLPEQQPRTA